MSRLKIAGYTLTVTLIAVTCMAALSLLLKQPTAPLPQVLFIGDGASESWSRTEAGARDAARDFGLLVHFQNSTPGNLPDQQSATVGRINHANFDGVAFCPADTVSQIELINGLAKQTKLVTVGKDADQSNRLCHVGFCPFGSGRMVAWLARAELSHGGKVALLYSGIARSADVTERLEGFKEAWVEAEECDATKRCSMVSVPVDSANIKSTSNGMPTIATDPQLALVVAFDNQAAKFAIKAFAKQRRVTNVSLIAFDPGVDILDAIDDGRVSFAIYDDPYRKGYEAIERLALYCHDDPTALPMPGHGSVPLIGEVVRKANLADFRRRAQPQRDPERLANHRFVAAPSVE